MASKQGRSRVETVRQSRRKAQANIQPAGTGLRSTGEAPQLTPEQIASRARSKKLGLTPVRLPGHIPHIAMELTDAANTYYYPQDYTGPKE